MHDTDRGFAPERKVADHHAVQRGPERIDVAAGVHVEQALGLLRRHVRRRAHGETGHGQAVVARLDLLGDPEVGELGHPAARQEDILGLDIAMHDPHLMRFPKSLRNVVNNGQGPPFVQLLPPSQQVVEALALDVFHQNEVQPPGFVHVEGPDAVGRGQLSRELGLALETLHIGRVPGQVAREELHGGKAAQLDMPGLVDSAHAPLADLGDDLVIADSARDIRRQTALRVLCIPALGNHRPTPVRCNTQRRNRDGRKDKVPHYPPTGSRF